METELENAKIEYSPVLKISNEVFTKKASEILNIPIDFIQVRRKITSPNFGSLSVFVFNNADNQEYYALRNGEKCYSNLPSNIDMFSETLFKIIEK